MIKSKLLTANIVIIIALVSVQLICLFLYAFLSEGNIERADIRFMTISIAGGLLYVMHFIAFQAYIMRRVEPRNIRLAKAISLAGLIVSLPALYCSIINFIGYATF